MAKNVFKLNRGILINETLHKDVEMRDLTAGDIIKSIEESRQLFIARNGTPVLIAPEEDIAINAILKIITKLGDIPMPLTRIVFEKLAPEDMDLLISKYMELRGAGSENLATAGRS